MFLGDTGWYLGGIGWYFGDKGWYLEEYRVIFGWYLGDFGSYLGHIGWYLGDFRWYLGDFGWYLGDLGSYWVIFGWFRVKPIWVILGCYLGISGDIWVILNMSCYYLTTVSRFMLYYVYNYSHSSITYFFRMSQYQSALLYLALFLIKHVIFTHSTLPTIIASIYSINSP